MEWDICTHVLIVPMLNLNMCSKPISERCICLSEPDKLAQGLFQLEPSCNNSTYVFGIEMCDIHTNFYIMI